MARFKSIRLIAVSLITVICFFATLSAEKTEEFERLFEWYQKSYNFISMADTIFTFESEFDFPRGYRRLDSTRLSPYSGWISHFPLWHRWKPVGIWKGYKYYEADEISRVVHLPWKSYTFIDCTIPVRILGEFLYSQNKEFDLKIIPRNGEVLTYDKWLNGKPAYAVGKKLFFRPSEKRDTSVFEYYRYLDLCMQNVNYKSLADNCDLVNEKDLTPGDLMIAYDESGKKGYAYVILNMLVNEREDRLYIVATGCNEACDFHIPLINSDRDFPWLTLEKIKGLAENMAFSGFFRFKITSNYR